MVTFKNEFINNYCKSLINICKESRLRYKITQKKLAEYIGVSQSLISFFLRLNNFAVPIKAFVYLP